MPDQRLTEDEKREWMLALARTFPSHARLEAWNPEKVNQRAMRGASHGEKVTARFLLSVWNQWETHEIGRFDLFEALQVWDPEHLAAFRAWMADPIRF